MAYKKIQPLGSKLIVLPLPAKEEKVESLFIPETANAELSRGTIVEVSEEAAKVYSVGDTIIYSTGSGQGIFYLGKPHLWLNGTSAEVYGIETDEE